MGVLIPLRRDVVGYIMYGADGYVSVAICQGTVVGGHEVRRSRFAGLLELRFG